MLLVLRGERPALLACVSRIRVRVAVLVFRLATEVRGERASRVQVEGFQ